MKKEYLKPEMMISLFDTKDVITASGAGSETATGLTAGESASIGDTGASTGISIPYDELI